MQIKAEVAIVQDTLEISLRVGIIESVPAMNSVEVLTVCVWF